MTSQKIPKENIEDVGKVFEGKRVLMVCAETFSWPMHYIAKELRNFGTELEAIFIQPAEDYFCDYDFKLFRKLNKDIKIHGLKDVAIEYIKKHKQAKDHLDLDYILEIERKYTHFSNLNEQFLSEMTLLPYYHDRNYYGHLTYEKILLFAGLMYKHLENLFKTSRPDIIIDSDVDFFGRAVLLEIAFKLNIPYISIDFTRIDGIVLPTLNLLRRINPKFEKEFEVFKNDPSLLDDKNLKDFRDKVFKEAGSIPKIFQKDYNQSLFSLKSICKKLLIQTLIEVRFFSFWKMYLNIRHGLSSPILSKQFKSIGYTYLYYFRRLYLHYGSVFESIDLKKIDYIYIPLHVIPESSTTILSPQYINETFLIESISKSIPADEYIIVKEHWSMIGHRPIKYYNNIKKLPNVILVDPTQHNESKPYIANAKLVVTISGSAALEGTLMGINSLVFSDVIFSLLGSVKKVHIDSNLRQTIKNQKELKVSQNEVCAYLKLILTYGSRVNIKDFLLRPELANKEKIEGKIIDLLQIYSTGLKLFEESQRVENSGR